MSAHQRKRRLIGKLPTMGDREIVFLCEDAVELDLVSGYAVETKRVFFNDVHMITWHRQFSRWGLWIGALSVLGALISLYYLVTGSGGASAFDHAGGSFWVIFWIFIAPNVLILVWFMRPYAYVTVFGSRTRATMRWHFRHRYSRQLYDELVRVVTAHQERDRSAQAVLQAQRSARALPAAAMLPVPDEASGPADRAAPSALVSADPLQAGEPLPSATPGDTLGGSA
jgi:hypothetical protein